MIPRPPLRYHGSKWRIAPWIISHFPPHRIYVEPFGGGAAVLLNKPRSEVEVYNDLDREVVNFFRVLRDPDLCRRLCTLLHHTPYSRHEYDLAFRPCADPVERARRLAIKAHFGFGSNSGTRRSKSGFRCNDWSTRSPNNHTWPKLPHALEAACERLQGVVIEEQAALKIMAAQDGPETLFYLDPPYVHATRCSYAKDRSYRHEMDDAGHRELFETAQGLRGHVLVSGYRSALYDELYRDWPRVEKEALTQGNAKNRYRTEVLWIHPRTWAAKRSRELPLAG